jgi:hypothetical protein
MGASLSWFAVRGKKPEEVLQTYGLKNVGKAYRNTPFCGGILPSGWFLLIHGRHEFTNDEARRLSKDCEVGACFVEEHVMVSCAAGWRSGEQIWCITHNSEEGSEHLDVEGDPPAGFAEIRDSLTKRQKEAEGVDLRVDFIFDIPVKLVKEITGYSHNDRLEVTFDNFVKPTFFQKLFGRS